MLSDLGPLSVAGNAGDQWSIFAVDLVSFRGAGEDSRDGVRNGRGGLWCGYQGARSHAVSHVRSDPLGRPRLRRRTPTRSRVNGRCIEAAGAGISLANAPARDPRGPMVDPNTLDPTALARAITRVLDEPGFGQAARQLAGEIEMTPGTEHTAEAPRTAARCSCQDPGPLRTSRRCARRCRTQQGEQSGGGAREFAEQSRGLPVLEAKQTPAAYQTLTR